MKIFAPFLFLLLTQMSLFAQDESNYSDTPAESHSFIILLSDNKADFPETRAGITRYVWTKHASDGLKVKHIVFGENKSISAMHIGSFKDKATAIDFYKKLKQNRPDFLQMGLTKDYFLISETNYNQLLLTPSIKDYMVFFKSNYL